MKVDSIQDGLHYGAHDGRSRQGAGRRRCCKPRQIGEDPGPYPGGAVWADVDVAQLGREMRRVRDSSEERASRATARTALAAEQFSRERIGGRIRSLLEAGVKA